MRLDLKVVIGVSITAFLLWWILRDVPFGEVWTQIQQAHLGLLLAAVTVATSGFLIRALRWKVLLQPVSSDTSLRNRFAAVNIGFMANNLLPARVGEFARAYALSRIETVSMSAALGSLVVERVLDALVLMGILLAAIFSPSFPASVRLSGGPLGTALNTVIVLLLLLVVVITLLLVIPRTVVRVTERLALAFPGDLARPVVAALEAFLGSLEVFRSPKLFLLGLFWSVGLWLWHGLSFWLAMLAFDIHAGPVAAYFTEAVVGFGVAIPAAPGFFGTFHASASWALSVFDVPAPSSLAFAFGYHLGAFIPVTVIGLYYASRIGLSIEDVGESETRVKEVVKRQHSEVVHLRSRRTGGSEGE
uniref:Putative integral membrane protein n=1 Tax=uncultured marine thaumarchaeote AD1000_100_C06 TaxID=1455887 RepID=A0A075FHU7_9ARCH|nr:putative integral membrane protein [uncultured marine thaumarchaeote AD1000_100_C06]